MSLKQEFEKRLRSVSGTTYREWLVGYLNNGGSVTHVYDYPVDRWDWHTMTRDSEIPAFHGAKAYNIIVPKRRTVTEEVGGHSDVYYMDEYQTDSIVPVFSDILHTLVSDFPDAFRDEDIYGLEHRYRGECQTCGWTSDIKPDTRAAKMAIENHEFDSGHCECTITRPLVLEQEERVQSSGYIVHPEERSVTRDIIHVYDSLGENPLNNS